MDTIKSNLLEWYEEHHRMLPWRINRDAYRVWVSEIMLQQTRVEAVIPYFEQFIKALPDVESLSRVEDDKLFKLWEGLGYYSRVRNMKKAAIQCMDLYHKKLPCTYKELLTLSGIGPYTAGAIASIAFKQQVCAIDGNVLRVYARLYAIKENILSESVKKQIQAIIEEDLAEDMGIFNQALMDLGSGICIPNGNPRCNICCLNSFCVSYKEGVQNQIPLREKKKSRKKLKYSVIIYTCQNHVLIHKRKSTGLLASLYEFVLEEGHKTKKDYPNSLYLGKYKHIFSHLEWDMKGFIIESDTYFDKEDYQWVKISEIENIYSIPSAFKLYKEKLLEIYK